MPHWRDFLDPSGPTGSYLPWKEVSRRTSLSRTTAWRLQKRDEFPAAYPISPGRVGHLEREVEAWIAARASAAPHPPEARREAPTTPPDGGGQPVRTTAAGPRPPKPQLGARPASERRRSRAAKAAPSQQITFEF